ncbi:hypothetical protein HKBW3S42_00203 [Candidatus Hakubella thermalkaliphila]|uniref:Class II aldolase/adducin N-terminal domain-containing protein n=1 Tax=Candidatus Hakubella thermalkaliphila TaxID=2754717 RepID=A0A6V8PI62_9ACTN|nr:hypothetical protein HKBW3S42_00203 [Candidatus Hakubella thermalkaliphila]GFP42645.1 hypothetical protein HKBW3C_01769 [Candidatus Hakubella thermalkaliphila]
MTEEETLANLIKLSRKLGERANHYVILGEGNTSARIDDKSFWVKASGVSLDGIDSDGFVKVSFEKVLQMLEWENIGDEEIKQGLKEATLSSVGGRHPSVETLLHALLLELENVSYVAHTHPPAVNRILCSKQAQEAIKGRLFPDEIVVCGIAPLYVPYSDPGVPLARAVQKAVLKYQGQYGVRPKVILLENHGLIALGSTSQEAENITAMYVKIAEILWGTFLLGGPNFLSESHANRIYTRPDEKYREGMLKGSGRPGS